MKSNLAEITVERRHETASAILVSDGEMQVWLPKSQIEIAESGDGRTIVVTLPQWIAEEKGLV